MLLTTTATVQNKNIKQYFGLVSGQAIMGANIIRDILAGIKDILGGRAGAYEEELKKAREFAMQEMMQQAKSLGANAIIGVTIDHEINQTMLMVSVYGTAVIVEDV